MGWAIVVRKPSPGFYAVKSGLPPFGGIKHGLVLIRKAWKYLSTWPQIIFGLCFGVAPFGMVGIEVLRCVFMFRIDFGKDILASPSESFRGQRHRGQQRLWRRLRWWNFKDACPSNPTESHAIRNPHQKICHPAENDRIQLNFNNVVVQSQYF